MDYGAPLDDIFSGSIGIVGCKRDCKEYLHAIIETCYARERMNTLNFYNKPCREDDTHEN